MTAESTILARIRRYARRAWARRRPISWRRVALVSAGFGLIFHNMEITGSTVAIILGIILLVDAVEHGRR